MRENGRGGSVAGWDDADAKARGRPRVTRRRFLQGAALGGLAIGGVLGCRGASERRNPVANPHPSTGLAGGEGNWGDRPNIVLVFPDQFRADTMGCVGHPAVQTPNLDRLAAEGVTFTSCYTNSPLCMPARASLITGQYVHQHGAWVNGQAADRFGPSQVRNIRAAGYHTAHIGKTHLYVPRGAGNHLDNYLALLMDWGYDEALQLPGPMEAQTLDSAHSDYLAAKGLLDIYRGSLVEFRKGLDSGRLHRWEDPVWPLATEDHLDSFTGRAAVEWIKGYEWPEPFYLQIHFPGPHSPFDSPAEYRALYRREEMPTGIVQDPAPPVAPQVASMSARSGIAGMTVEQKQQIRVNYYGKVTLIDHWIGEVCRALEERGLLENTWVLVSSDHGEMLGDFRLMEKSVFYEGAATVPCVIRPPGGVAGWQAAGLVEHLDLTATLIDIAGAEPLGDGAGCSLLPRLREGPDGPGAQEGKEAVFSEVSGYSMVRTARYKMSVNARTRRVVDLYDMVDDPEERRNLVEDVAYAAVRRELLEEHLGPFLDGGS